MADPTDPFSLASPVPIAPRSDPDDPFTLAIPVGGTAPGPREAETVKEAILAGMQDNSLGLALRGEMPDTVLGEDAPWYMRLGRGVGALAGDFPAGVAGAGLGLAATRGSPIGALAGGFALPMALRGGLVEAYTHNYAMNWEGAWAIAKAGAKEGAKGLVIGAATGGAGKVVAPLFAGASAIAKGVGAFGAELTALTTTAAALEGHVPTWQEFLDNALLLGGMKGAVHTAKGIAGVWRDTGVSLPKIVLDAQKDPALKAYIEGDTTELPAPYKQLALDERIKASVEADPRPEYIRSVLGAKEPPLLGEKPLHDPVKYEYITDQDTLKGTLRLVEQQYASEIAVQTRGVVTNKASAAEAMRLVAEGDVVEHVVGSAENAAQIYARAHVLKGVTQNAYAKIRALEGIPEADLTPRMKLEALASIEQLSMVLAEYRGARAEAGRALQIFNKVKRDSSLLGEAETLIKLAERKGSLQDVAALVATLKDPAQMQRFAKGYVKATTTEKVLEAWKAGLVSGPQTHLANIMGNLTKWSVEVPESVLAATITASIKLAKGDPLSMAQYKARAFAPIYGLQFGARDALTIAGEVWRQQGAHLEKADVYRTAIEGKTGEVIRLPFKALQMEDVLFRTVAERAKAYEMAVDRATKEGVDLRTAEGREIVVKYTQSPEVGLTEPAAVAVLNKIQEAGAEAVFAQRLGPRLETVQRAMAGHWTQGIIPFFRTPANLVSWAIQHIPGLNLMSGRWRNDFAAGGEQRSRAIARVVIGTALATTAYQLAEDGLITGSGILDPEMRKTKTAAGWQPNSVKVGDKYYSVQRLEPVAKVLTIAADLHDLMQLTTDDNDKAKAATLLVLLFGNATVSATYMSGLANTINSVTDPKRYGETLLEQYASSLVPKIVGQTAAMIDPDKREVDGVLEAIQAQIPILRERLLPKHDVWGVPQKNDRWFDVLPVTVTTETKDAVAAEALRLQFAMSDAPRFVIEKGPLKEKEKRIDLEQKARNDFKILSGNYAKEILAPLVASPDWNSVSEYAKMDIFAKVVSGARKRATYDVLPGDAPARIEMREKMITEINKQYDEAMGKVVPPTKPERRVK